MKKEILADGLTKEEAAQLEMLEIERLKATDPLVGYNISKGGFSTFAGLIHTDAHKEMMHNKYLGRTFSEETLERMRAAHAKERKKVLCTTNSGAIVCYGSLGEAAVAVGGHKSNISRACKNNKQYKGCSWQLAKEVV